MAGGQGYLDRRVGAAVLDYDDVVDPGWKPRDDAADVARDVERGDDHADAGTGMPIP
jgi:hypothetical protein